MKKTIELSHPKIKYPRLIERAKNDLRKYVKRERRKTLPEGADFWDFDCRFGDTEADAKPVHLAELDGCISEVEKRELKAFYVEVLAKPGYRAKKPRPGEERPMPVVPPLKKLGEH